MKRQFITLVIMAGMITSHMVARAEEPAVGNGNTAATVNEGDHSAAKSAAVAAAVPALRVSDGPLPPVDMHKRAEELKNLKWGMFICWSFSTFSGKEWTMGVKDLSLFRATSVDTDQWAKTAKEAGMGYILFLTKHHDGFCLWDTKTTERKVTNAPLKRDVLAELCKSCDKYGIKLALYFSLGEFKDNKDYHPGGYTPEMMKAQLKELLTQYGPIEYIWFDTAQGDGGLNHKEMTAWCHQWQPGTLLGFAGGQAAGEVAIREVGRPGPLGNAPADSYNRNRKNEATYPGYLLAEFTYPILPAHSGGAQWFYSLPKHDQLCLPAEVLYAHYLGAVKYGNIFEIDLGPDYEGKLREIDVKTLQKVGEMIRSGAKLPDVNPQRATAQKPQPSPEEKAQREARLKWFHEAKYGLFINWGLYSIPAGEWKGRQIPGIGDCIMLDAKIPVKEYEQLAKRFNPTKFNAEEWAQLAVDAGMKYVVFDCKHIDGFAMYDSKVSPYNVVAATPWKRDPFKELQVACAKRGLKLCFYYSQSWDYHEPNGAGAGAGNNWDFPPIEKKDFDQHLRDKSLPQVRELLTNYGPIGLIWFDVPTLMTPARSRQFVDLVRSLQPDTLINSRLGYGGYHDYASRGDNEIPPTVTPGVWETAATINGTWGYKKNDHNWKTPKDICFKLVDIVSKGGNYLLNVGPDADGVIPLPSQDVLRQVGAWLKVNGEAIYGAGRTPFGEELGAHDLIHMDAKGRSPFRPKTDWRCTTKPGKLYLHFFKWPGTQFQLSGVKGKISQAYLLAGHQSVPITQTDKGVTISLPQTAPDALATVLCLEVTP